MAQTEQSMFLFQQPWFTGGGDTSNEKERLRIPNPKRLEHIVTTEQSEVDITPGEFRIEFEPGVQQIRRQHASSDGLERGGKGLQLSKLYSHTGSHFVPTKLLQVFAAFLQ